MKKFFTLIVVLFLALGLKAQDVVVLKHTNYTSHFSKSKKYPVMVEWWETKAKIGCPNPLPRKDNFKPDPLLPNETNIGADDVNSGTDRGHLMPAKSNQCQTPQVQDECFYYSNMAAQYHSLNAGDWKSLETLTREWALSHDSIHIWAGNVGEAKRIGKVAVPTKCWKVVYVAKTKEWFAYLFDNNTSKPDGLNNNKVLVSDIEKLTGLKFQ
jgi:DNA/RNA endonuclease G (NUC1)